MSNRVLDPKPNPEINNRNMNISQEEKKSIFEGTVPQSFQISSYQNPAVSLPANYDVFIQNDVSVEPIFR